VSAPIHPELSRLHERYVQLVDGVRAGVVDAGEAYRLLDQITSLDANGSLWGVDQDGNFTRRTTPDAAPQVTPPGLYAAPAGPGQVASPFAPGIAHPVEQPVPAPVRIPPQRPLPTAETHLPSDDALARGGRAAKRTGERRGGGVATSVAERFAQLRNRERSGGDGAVARVVAGNRTTIIVAVAVGVVVLVAGATKPDPVPVAQTSTTVSSVPGTPVGVLPSADDFTRTVNTLLAGGDTAVRAVLEPGDATAAATEAGRWFAWGNAKLRVSAGPAAPSGSGAVQTWTVLDAAGSPVQQLEASWVRTDAGWVLATWPRLS
jgi:hypothetical protein